MTARRGMRVGIVGAGVMAEAMISGLLANKGDQLGGTFEDARALHVAWQVAPQRNDATHSGFLVQVEKSANALL